MKTNSSARYLVRLRDIILGAALAAIFGIEFYAGAFLAGRIGHTSACQMDGPATPNVGISDLMAAAR